MEGESKSGLECPESQPVCPLPRRNSHERGTRQRRSCVRDDLPTQKVWIAHRVSRTQTSTRHDEQSDLPILPSMAARAHVCILPIKP